MTDEDETISVLLGLLDFDSDRATAHASFVVASIFGVYALLSSFNYFDSYNGKIVFGSTYFLLTCLSFYSFLNFSKYASSAEKTQRIMRNNYLKGARAEKIKDELEKKEESKDFIIIIRELLDSNTWKNWKTKVFFVTWLFAVSVPFVWILFK